MFINIRYENIHACTAPWNRGAEQTLGWHSA